MLAVRDIRAPDPSSKPSRRRITESLLRALGPGVIYDLTLSDLVGKSAVG